ncbi:MAG: hypothetical protein WCT31_00475, partial [Candidatus Micrarchaeia archaeon]
MRNFGKNFSEVGWRDSKNPDRCKSNGFTGDSAESTNRMRNLKRSLLFFILLLLSVQSLSFAAGECVDPDGKDVSIKGTTSWSIPPTFQVDSCANANTVKEWYCPVKHGDTEVSGTFVNIPCAFGYECKNGVCVNNAPVITCTETDSGNDIYNPGITTVTNDGRATHETDVCADSTHLKEYYCDGTEIKVNAIRGIECPSGFVCSEGACIANQYTCTDSDNGKDVYKFGSTIWNYPSQNWQGDVCLSDTTIKEYFCEIGANGIIQGKSENMLCGPGYGCKEYEPNKFACVPLPFCTDPDGQDSSVATAVSWNYPSLIASTSPDGCFDKYTVLESICINNPDNIPIVDSVKIKCNPNFECKNGACVSVLQAPVAEAESFYQNKVALAGQSSQFELIKDWKVLSALLIIITLLLLIFAYIAGQSFNMPELKAWGAVELNQLFVTILIIGILFFGMGFLDKIMADSLADSHLPDPLNPGSELACKSDINSNCAAYIAEAYVNDIQNMMQKDVGDWLDNAAKEGQKMGRRSGINFVPFIYPIPTLWASFSVGWQPEKILDVERYNTVINFYTPMISSISAQKFFITEVVAGVAPSILLLGIVARSFFLTRRLGGLLIAMAIGVMFVLPLMYVFSWMSLNIAIFGTGALESDSMPVCPEECQQLAPVAYDTASGVQYFTIQDWADSVEKRFGAEETTGCYLSRLIDQKYSAEDYFSDLNDPLEMQKILVTYGYPSDLDCDYTTNPHGLRDVRPLRAEMDNYFQACYPEGPGVGSGFAVTNPNGYGDFGTERVYCPPTCRELPYPYDRKECSPNEVQYACSQLPKQCNIKKVM